MVLYEVEGGELSHTEGLDFEVLRGAETYASVRAPPFKRCTYTSRSSTKRSVPSPRRNGAGFLRASAQARTSSARRKKRCPPHGPYVSPSTLTVLENWPWTLRKLAGEDASAAWRPLEGALMEMRTLARVEVIVRDFGPQLNDEERAIARSLVEEEGRGLLALHAGADDFFNFECRNY
ncbi:hypothetical protein OH76DRAFT_1022015 [Lentinus brumalis]|uniref:Uncharacterized protein n=1 Tax=Lentinus brumalis TaxID=2498619 RepID=A0A371CXX1_9APHY|nr:hypothetical protein OH76DRAFT_1022015 [Polyporus brumalis]